MPFAWTDLVNVTASGSSLRKTSGCDGCPDAGAASVPTIPSGNGYTQFTASETNTLRFIGLSTVSAGTSATSIRFAIALQPGGIAEVRESGQYRADTPFVPGDVFRIGVQKNVIRYYKNETLIYKSTLPAVFPLRVDTALFTPNSTITNVGLYKTR